MQVTPSNNLLNALSGLQANRRPAPPAAAAGTTSFASAVQQSSGTQAANGPAAIQAVNKQPVPPVTAAASQPTAQRRPSSLGQYLDITV